MEGSNVKAPTQPQGLENFVSMAVILPNLRNKPFHVSLEKRMRE